MNDLKIKFGTNTNEIDANTLINSIIHFSSIVHEVNRELRTNRKIEVKIKSFEPGSFVVNIIIESGLIEKIGGLFTKENLEIAGNLVTVVGGVYGVAKFLGGEKPALVTNGDKTGITIENTQGDVTIFDNRVYNIYNRPVIQEALSKEFETLKNDERIDSFELSDSDNETMVNIERAEFNGISNINNSTLENSREITRDVILNIISLSFDPKKKWEFLYDGNKIQAKISDDVFLRHVDSGEAFAKGDTLKATIEIGQNYNELASAYANHSYKVTLIHEHFASQKQPKLPFDLE